MKIKLIITLTLIFFITLNGSIVFGIEDAVDKNQDATSSNSDDIIKALEDKIKQYEKKIEKIQGQVNTLQNEIEYSDNQIALTELKIQANEAEIEAKTNQIEKLVTNIEDIRIKIEKLAQSIVHQEEVYSERKRQHYKTEDTTPPDVQFFLFLIEPSQLSKKIQKETYSQVMQGRDKNLLDEMNKTKADYAKQKDLYEKRKQEEEALKVQIVQYKAQLEGHRISLAKQKADKQSLLKETQNNEIKYQTLLAQVQSELDALQKAENLPAGEGVEVRKGDVIGYMGNTGCSSGPHVHFGYIKGKKTRDPLSLLKSGYLKWPVKNYDVTQYFGENYSFYIRNFGIPGHDALDIRSTSQWTGAPIYAAKDGVLYHSRDSKVYCPSINNSIGKGAIIDHGNDEKTIYWHLQ